MTTSPKLSIPLLDDAQAGKVEQANRAFRHLEAIVACNPLDRDLNSPPGSPSDGDCYIIGASPSGWGPAGHLAYYRNGEWQYQTPTSGLIAYVTDEKVPVCYSAIESEWFPLQPQDWTTEHWTGQYRGATGSKVYAKTFRSIAMPTSGTTNTAHGVSNIDLTHPDCAPAFTGKASFIGGVIPLPTVDTSFSVSAVSADPTNLTMTTNYAAAVLTACVRMEYCIYVAPPE